MVITKSSAKRSYKVRQTTGGKDLAFGSRGPSKPKKKPKPTSQESRNRSIDLIPPPETQLALNGMVALPKTTSKSAKKSASSRALKRQSRMDPVRQEMRAVAREAANRARSAQERLRITALPRATTERNLAAASMAAYQADELPEHLRRKTKNLRYFTKSDESDN